MICKIYITVAMGEWNILFHGPYLEGKSYLNEEVSLSSSNICLHRPNIPSAKQTNELKKKNLNRLGKRLDKYINI